LSLMESLTARNLEGREREFVGFATVILSGYHRPPRTELIRSLIETWWV
jgi:hypothetical protein